MKPDLIAISLENFGSFKTRQSLPLPSTPGLYHMQGVNQVDPRLTGNGTGKSTIWKGLFWNLFERTPDGLKAGDVCNWEVDKGSRVTLDFLEETEQGPIQWVMRRNWKPNSWTLDHVAEFVTDEQTIDLAKGFPNWLKDWFPSSPDLFLNSILMSQEAPTFLDLKPEAQATLFGEVLKLDHWLELSRKASERASEQDRKNRSMEATVARLEGAVGQRQDFTSRIDSWDADQQHRIDRVVSQYEKLLTEFEALKAKKVNAGSQELLDRQRQLDLSLAEYRSKLRESIERAGGLKVRLEGLSDQINELEAHTHEFDSGRCPTCGSEVNPKKHRLQIEARAIEFRDEADRLHRETEKVTRLINRLTDLEATDAAELDRVEEKIRAANGAVRERERQLTDLNRQLDQLEDDHERLRSERNPWRGAQKEASERARIDQEALFKARQGLDKGYERFSLYSYWIRGFKELRLYHIAQALHELEIEVNSALVELGLPGWELHFEVDRENKKGGIQRGFSVRVTTPHTTRSVPWAAWSGGEKQRLRIAASMGMANMIRSRMPPTLALEVWDEPTKGMSPQGVQDLMTALARRARVEQRIIIVVDHTAPTFGDFSGRATVTKTAEGSQIAVDWEKQV